MPLPLALVAFAEVIGGLLALAGATKFLSDRFSDLDKATRLGNRLDATIEDPRLSKAIFKDLSDIAVDVGSRFQPIEEFFLRINDLAPDLGKTEFDVVRLTEVVQRLGANAEKSIEDVNAGAAEFAVAIANGNIDASEFEDILTRFPELVKAIADGLDEDIIQLLDPAAGGVGSGKAVDALLRQATEVGEAFEDASLGYDRLLQSFQTTLALGVDKIGELSDGASGPDSLRSQVLLQDEARNAAELHTKALGDLGTEAKDFGAAIQESAVADLIELRDKINTAIETNEQIIAKATKPIDSVVSSSVRRFSPSPVNPRSPMEFALPLGLEKPLDQIKELRHKAKNGEIDSKAFANGILQIAEQHSALEPLAKKLREIVETLNMAGENLEIEKNIRTLIDARIGQGEITVPVPSPAEQAIENNDRIPGAADSIGATTNETIAAAEASKKCLEELAAAANQAREALNGTDVAVKEATGGQEDLAGATDKTVAATEDACAAVEANRKCLEELATATDQAGVATERAGAATEMLVQSSAGLGPGLEQESKQLAARAKIVPGLTQQLKKEFDSRNLVARLVQILGRELLPEEIQQLNELIALRGQTVEQLDAEAEARRDVAQASGEQAAAAAGAGNATGGTGGGTPFDENPESIANQFGRPFEIVAGDIQQEFAGLFDRLFEDGIGAFANMGRNIKGIFSRLASDIARSLIFQPQVLGIGGLAGGLGGILSGVFSGSVAAAGGNLLGTGAAGAGGAAAASGKLTSFLANSPVAATFAAAGLGALGGNIIGGVTGLNKTGSTIGGGVGATAGFILSIGNPVVAAIGAAIGSVIGGLIGSAFSGDTSLQLQTARPGSGTVFEDFQSQITPFGELGFFRKSEINKKETPELVSALAGIDEAIAAVLLPEQIEAATEALLAQTGGGGRLGEGLGTRINLKGKDFGASFFNAIQERLTVILEAALPERTEEIGRAFAQIVPSAENVEKLAQTAVEIIEFTKLLDELTGNAEPLTRAEQQLRAINDQFAELTKQAKRLGFAEAQIVDARDKAIAKLKTDADEINAFELLKLTDPIRAERQALIELQEERLREVEALGANVELLKMRNAAELELFENQRLAADGLRNLLIDLTAGPQSTLPTNVVLTNALDRFESLRAAAIGGDFSAREALGGASQDLLAVARDAFASSPQFFEIQQRVIDTLDLLVSANENAAVLTAAAIGGEVKAAIEPVLQDIGAEAAESNDELRKIQDQLAAVLSLSEFSRSQVGLFDAARAVPPTSGGDGDGGVEGRLASAR